MREILEMRTLRGSDKNTFQTSHSIRIRVAFSIWRGRGSTLGASSFCHSSGNQRKSSKVPGKSSPLWTQSSIKECCRNSVRSAGIDIVFNYVEYPLKRQCYGISEYLENIRFPERMKKYFQRFTFCVSQYTLSAKYVGKRRKSSDAKLFCGLFNCVTNSGKPWYFY